MSCGNRFSCGIKRYQSPQFVPDRPSNPELHKENENRLAEMMRLREEQDKALSYSSVSSITSTTSLTLTQDDTLQSNTIVYPSQDTTYAPWLQKQKE